jgi:phosphoribosylformimino-5-aminoimidazole carboxamide ribotide isomerase
VRVIPVIDLKQGRVVRAVGGKREAYRPVKSVVADGCSAASIAAGLVERVGASEAYLADLDAIAGAEPAWDEYRQIGDAGLELWVDAGIGDRARAGRLVGYQRQGTPLYRVIVGLESVPGPRQLSSIANRIGRDRLTLSLDLMEGWPLVSSAGWRAWSAPQIGDFAVEIGIRRIIVLDLARVGQGQGTGTEALCRRLHQAHPALELIAGGGVSRLDEIEALSELGCSAVLIGSALHDGRLTAKQLHAAGLLRSGTE